MPETHPDVLLKLGNKTADSLFFVYFFVIFDLFFDKIIYNLHTQQLDRGSVVSHYVLSGSVFGQTGRYALHHITQIRNSAERYVFFKDLQHIGIV